MATHRDDDAPGAGAAGYAVGYPGSGYSTTHYPTGPAAEETTGHGRTQHAERIARYPDPVGPAERPADGPVSRPGSDPVSPAAGRPTDAAAGEDLRLVEEDLPVRPADSPTAAYPMTRPAQAPSASPTTAPPAPPAAGALPGPGRGAPQPGAPYPGVPQSGPPQPGGAPQPPPQSAPPGAGAPAPLSDLMQPPASGAPASGYPAAGRSQLGWVLAVLTIVFEVPVAVVLVRSLLDTGLAVGGVVASLALLPGIPLFAAGVYGLFQGRIRPAQGEGPGVLLHRPGCYLLVGALLLVVAGLAAG